MQQGIESIPSPKKQWRPLPSLLSLSFFYDCQTDIRQRARQTKIQVCKTDRQTYEPCLADRQNYSTVAKNERSAARQTDWQTVNEICQFLNKQSAVARQADSPLTDGQTDLTLCEKDSNILSGQKSDKLTDRVRYQTNRRSDIAQTDSPGSD